MSTSFPYIGRKLGQNKLNRLKSTVTDVNSGRAGGGILCRLLFIELHRRRGLSHVFEITLDEYFDFAFVIILLYMWQ